MEAVRSERAGAYSYVKLFLAALVAIATALTGIGLAASPASASTGPVIANGIAGYALLGTPGPKALTGTAPSAKQTDAPLTAAVANVGTATTLSFASVSVNYVFAPVGNVDVYANGCDYLFTYTANPFTVSGTSVNSGGTGVTGVSLVSATAIPSSGSTCTTSDSIATAGSEVYQTGAPNDFNAIAQVTGGASAVNTASLTITSQPAATNGYAWANTSNGQIYMTPEPTATGNFTLTYAYCLPGVTLGSDPSGLSDGNCSSATVTYVAATHCELVGESVSVSISSSTIYQSLCTSTSTPATVTPGQTFTFNTLSGTSVIPVEESTSVGNATIQYGDNFTAISPVPSGLNYVPGSAHAVGGDPATLGVATVQYCTAPRTGCDATLSGNYHTTYPYLEEQLAASTHINGGSIVTLPSIVAQFTVPATTAPGTTFGTAASEFRLNTQVQIPIIGSNTAAFDGYPTTCPTSATNSTPQNSYVTAQCPTSGTPTYVAPTIVPFTTVVPGVSSVSTPSGSASGTDAGGSTVTIKGIGFTGASAVNFGATPATSFTVNSNTSITAVSPAASSDGPVDITVVNATQTSQTSSADTFTYYANGSVGPDAPTNVQVTPGDGSADGAATVSWNAANGEGSAITGYNVTATDNTNAANGGQTCTGSDPTDTCSLSGLTEGDSYTFAVTSTNAVGTSAATTVTVTEGAPSAPTAVSATGDNSSGTGADVSFTAPAVSGDGSTISGYTVTATDLTNPANGGQTASGTASPITVNGLTGGDNYSFTVTATNSSGTSQASSASASILVIGTAGAPTGVNATTGANTQSVVSFTPSSSTGGATPTSYTVTSSPDGKTCTYTVSSSSGDYPYSCTVTGLTNGTSYTFTVTATNAGGTGPASAASAAIVPSTVPGAPTGVTAVSNTSGGVVVSWTAPASNGGATITNYTATSSSGSKTCSTATTSCTITGTTIGTSYTYTVVATNVSGNSAASAASASVKTTSVPSAPTAVAISSVPSTTSVAVSFTGDTTTATQGGGTISGYTVTAHDLTSPGSDCDGCTGTGTTSPITVTGLTTGDNYNFTVTATNQFGTSAASAASPNVAPGNKPTAPLNVSVAQVSPIGANASTASIVVSWNPPATPNGVTSYTATSSSGSKTCTYTVPTDGSAETDTCTVTGLTTGTAYTFTVTATNPSGTSPASAASASITPQTLPAAPTAVTAVTGNAQSAVSFTGDTTAATTGGSAITGYTVTAIDSTNVANGGQSATGTASPITVTGLTNGDSYTFTVTATTAAGTSVASTASAALNTGQPNAPTGVVAGADGSSSTVLDISWTAATSPDGTSAITGYSVSNASGGKFGA